MTSPLHDLDLRFSGPVSTQIAPEGITAHYGGPTPWGPTADRSSPDRFRDTTDHARCPSIVRAWHAFHLSKRWVGLAYTSAICPHGHRFEGRGRGRRTGANGTNPGNARSYAVVYVAGDRDPVTAEAKAAFLDEEDRLGVPLRWDHSDWKATACAGEPLRSWEATGWAAPTTTPNPAPTPAPAPAPAPTLGGRVSVSVSLPILRAGSTGPHVEAVQALVNIKAGRRIAVDGDFGSETGAAIRDVQRFFRLTVDGIVGAQTWSTLLELPL